MTRDEFIGWLESVGAHYTTGNEFYPDAIYVHGKVEKMVNERTGEIMNYEPYIRVSGFESNRVYIRDNGFCHHTTENVLKEEILCNYIW